MTDQDIPAAPPFINMQTTLTNNLLTVAGAYTAVHRIAFSWLSLQAHGKADFLQRIRKPKMVMYGIESFRVRKYDEFMQWCSDNWPVGAVWPSHIDRPPPTPPEPPASTADAA